MYFIPFLQEVAGEEGPNVQVCLLIWILELFYFFTLEVFRSDKICLLSEIRQNRTEKGGNGTPGVYTRCTD